MGECQHKMPIWRVEGPNEDHWHCADCGVALGFRPDLDRSHTDEKVASILDTLHESGLTYVSNGTMGDIMTESVSAECRGADAYDQKSIIVLLMQEPNMAGNHKAFWRDRAREWFSSKDSPHA